ncbi:MAG: cation:proton antiporter [Deltaproteobacteria bacterium]|nr:cation:proton antiporter [Deltaproteobacteria bacterium]
MAPHDFLLALLVLLTIASVTLVFFHRLGLGSVLGLLAAGVVIGPTGLDLARRVADVRRFSELGVVLLLFVVGLEMHPKRVWELRRAALLGFWQVLLTGAAIALYVRFIGLPTATALIIGYGFALSSTAVVLQLMQERGQLDRPAGQTTFGILLMQDLAVVPLLAAVPLLAGRGGADAHGPLARLALVLGALLAVVVIVRLLLPAALDRLERARDGEAFAAVAMLAVVAAALVMEEAGASMALGTFLAGVLLSESPHRQRIEQLVLPFQHVLLSLFFVAAGMSIDLGALLLPLRVLLVHAVVLIVIKAAVLIGLCRAFALRRGDAWRIGLVLAQCGEFGFVLFAAAESVGLMHPAGFSVAAVLIGLSMAVTPLLARVADRIH